MVKKVNSKINIQSKLKTLVEKNSLEEKLKKLIPIKKEEDKIDIPKEKDASENKDNKTEPQNTIPHFEQKKNFGINLQKIVENKEPPKIENLEMGLTNSPENNSSAIPEKESELVKYTHNDLGKYQASSQKYNSDKHDDDIKNIDRNLNRDSNSTNTGGLINTRPHNPFNQSRGSIETYTNSYSNNNQNGKQDGARMYEETQQRFYEASQRDVHSKNNNKNI